MTFPTIQRSSNGPDDERKRVEEHHQQRHLTTSSRHDRNYYSTSQRPSSVPSKTEYPPPAHSRVPTTKSSEKIVSGHQTMQKAEVNMFGYPAYQPTAFFPQEPKSKSDHHHKSGSQASGLVVTKSSGISDRDRDILTNPSALMNEHKSSVIVKLEGKTPHHIDSRSSVAHSQSPKLQQEMMRHYLPVGSQAHKGLYEYRSPTQSPHHLQHTPSPHHSIETQSIGKSSHHRSSSGQLPSPHHHRQSPHSHSQTHPPTEVRYRSVSESQAMMYQPSVKGSAANYSYMATMAPYTVVGNTVSNSKPKVSSPAPHHIYGKPSPGVGNNIPMTRGHESPAPNSSPLSSKPLLSSSVSPSPYQQVSHYLSPPPHPTTMPTCLPPPAHSSKPTLFESRMYPPGNSVPGGLSVKPSIQHGTSPPTAASAPSPISRSHPQYTLPGNTHNSQMLGSQSVQTAPLDLGVSSNKYESATSPKRKATPMNSVNSGPVCLDIKKRRIEPPPTTPSPQSHSIYGTSSQPQLARVSEPSPLIASAATTITTVVNTAAYRGTPNTTTVTTPTPVTITESLPEISVTTVLTDKPQPNVTSESQTQSNNVVNLTTATTTTVVTPTNLTTTAQPSPAESPNTPVKTNVPPSTVDSEKSNSPGPSKTQTSYPVRHLKKAWLQRHTGEDLEDNTGITGSGSCVTLPMNINNSNQTTKEPPVTSLHNIGSMAVNSINKGKHFSPKPNNRKGVHKESTSLNGHQDSNKGDDSSSSDAERGRKSPPKRKPPKVKRKKGGGAQKKNVDDHKKRKVGTQSVTVSESGSDSEKESGSEKDSDSGASTTITTKKPGTNPTKEPRKRGRRPKSSKNDKGEEPRTKKSRDDSMPQRDPIRKPPVGQLKKTGESFLQDGPCHEVAPKLAKCRECRMTPNQRSKNMPNIFCRFYAFRRLRYTKNGQLAIAGFSDPHKDALEVLIIDFFVERFILNGTFFRMT